MDKTIKNDPEARQAAEAALEEYLDQGGSTNKTINDVEFVRFDAEQDAWIMRIGRETYSISF